MAQRNLGTIGYVIIDMRPDTPIVADAKKEVFLSYHDAKAETKRIFSNLENSSNYVIAEVVVEPEHEYIDA